MYKRQDVYYYIRWRLKLEGETENTGVCTKERKGVAAEVLMATPCTKSLGGESRGHKHEGCDDDVYYYIRWRLKLEGETENMGVCTKERKGVAAEVLMATPCTKSLGGESGGHKHEGCGWRRLCWKPRETLHDLLNKPRFDIDS